MEEQSAVDYLIEILLTRGDFSQTGPIPSFTKTDCDQQFEDNDDKQVKSVNKSRSVKFNTIVTMVRYEDLSEEFVPIITGGRELTFKANKKENFSQKVRRFCRKVRRGLLFKSRKFTA